MLAVPLCSHTDTDTVPGADTANAPEPSAEARIDWPDVTAYDATRATRTGAAVNGTYSSSPRVTPGWTCGTPVPCIGQPMSVRRHPRGAEVADLRVREKLKAPQVAGNPNPGKGLPRPKKKG